MGDPAREFDALREPEAGGEPAAGVEVIAGTRHQGSPGGWDPGQGLDQEVHPLAPDDLPDEEDQGLARGRQGAGRGEGRGDGREDFDPLGCDPVDGELVGHEAAAHEEAAHGRVRADRPVPLPDPGEADRQEAVRTRPLDEAEVPVTGESRGLPAHPVAHGEVLVPAQADEVVVVDHAHAGDGRRQALHPRGVLHLVHEEHVRGEVLDQVFPRRVALEGVEEVRLGAQVQVQQGLGPAEAGEPAGGVEEDLLDPAVKPGPLVDVEDAHHARSCPVLEECSPPRRRRMN